MITYELRILFVFLVSLTIVLVTLPKLAHIAQRLGLVDHPNTRKIHTSPRPLVGGIGMVIAVTFSSLVFIPFGGLRGYFLGLAILLFVGFLDDFREIRPREKFFAQILATLLMMHFSKVALSSFGDLLGLGEIRIPDFIHFVWPVTIFCVVGVVNAVNLIDGLDGLAGGIALIAFSYFGLHAYLADNTPLMLLNLALVGAIVGFLRYNWHPSVLFMGDAGSLCLGFSLAFMALALTQGEGAVTSPIVALLILAVPITETLIVLFKRLLRRKSPFTADKYHVHHIFLRYGMEKNTVVRVILFLSILMGSLSLLKPVYNIADAILFSAFAVYFLIYLVASFYILEVLRYSLKVRNTKGKKISASYFLRAMFWSLDVFGMTRKKKRYGVNIWLRIERPGDDSQLSGKLLNVSESGCMVKMKGLAIDMDEAVLRLELPSRNAGVPLNIEGKRVWSSTRGCCNYQGFVFHKLTADDEQCLRNFIEELRRKRSRGVVEQAAGGVEERR